MWLLHPQTYHGIQDRLSKPLVVAKHIGQGQRRAETRPFYFEDEQGQRTRQPSCSRAMSRVRIAANIAKLPELLKR
jgi:hypothetical protein